MIWTGCPNSCAPVQVADVGLMGAQVKDPAGAKGMVPGVNIFIGGTVGPTGHLKEKAEIEKVALSELYPVVENVMIEKFGATRKATPTENPNNAARWKINKSAQYTKGVPKALGKQTHICTACGYIYSEEKPFDSLPEDYVCPSCSAPKSKFEKMKTDAFSAEIGETGDGVSRRYIGDFKRYWRKGEVKISRKARRFYQYETI